MRISLQTIFALLTLACLLALVQRERLNIKDLTELNSELEIEIAAIPSPPENDLPYLRRAAYPDPNLEELSDEIKQGFERTLDRWRANIVNTDDVSYFYAPSPDHYFPEPIHIFVPEDEHAFLQIHIQKQNAEGKVVVDSEPSDNPFESYRHFKTQLPPGVSKFIFRLPDKTKHGGMVFDDNVANTSFFGPGAFEFGVNDRIVHKLESKKGSRFGFPHIQTQDRQFEVEDRDQSFELARLWVMHMNSEQSYELICKVVLGGEQ